MKPVIPSISATFLIFILATFPVMAATIHIPADRPTIQAGIYAAVAGDLVLVSPGTYVENIDFLGKLITVQSEAGAEVTIIDGNSTDTVVRISGGTGEAVIDGFTIRNGYAVEGGGIFCNGPLYEVIITNCVITDNLLFCFSSWPFMEPCYGGGIYCHDSSPVISNCTITENSSAVWLDCIDVHGVGIYCSSASPDITNCTVSRNDGVFGGVIQCENDSSPTITNCTISDNEYTSSILFGTSTASVTNCAINGNYGGIVCYYYTDIMITNCTVFNNQEGFYGGGIDCYYSSATIENSIFWGNGADYGEEMSSRQGSTLTVSYSDVRGGEAAVYINGGTLQWLEGNIFLDPILVGEGDYHLTGESPCIDAGTDAGIYTDLEGDVRPQGAAFDMGADEYSGPPDCWDDDMDGYRDMTCGGYDCDDADPTRYPGAPENCNGIDNDCDGAPNPDEQDGDSDGYMICAGDCDDANPEVNPSVKEICDNGIDDDCDSFLDGEDTDCCMDMDGDGYGNPVSPYCTFLQWDCDDTDPLVYPGYPESTKMGNCDDGKDNDCDGMVDTDPECTPPCSVLLLPISRSPTTLYLIPTFVLFFFVRRFLEK